VSERRTNKDRYLQGYRKKKRALKLTGPERLQGRKKSENKMWIRESWDFWNGGKGGN